MSERNSESSESSKGWLARKVTRRYLAINLAARTDAMRWSLVGRVVIAIVNYCRNLTIDKLCRRNERKKRNTRLLFRLIIDSLSSFVLFKVRTS